MKWNFDLLTIIFLVLLLIIFIFLLVDYIKFRKFIMDNNEREKLFTDEQFKKYMEKLEETSVEEETIENEDNTNVDFDF